MRSNEIFIGYIVNRIYEQMYIMKMALGCLDDKEGVQAQ